MAIRNGAVVRLVLAHLLAVMAEWASIVAVLVYAFEQEGAAATGLASLALLAPAVIGAPITAGLTSSFRPHVVRRAALSAQVLGYGVAAGLAAAGASVVLVVAATVVAQVAVGTVRPTGAVLLPAAVRTTGELTVGTLAVSYCESASALLGPLTAAGLLALGGPEAVLGGCATALFVALLVSMIGARAGPPPAEHAWRPGPVLSGAMATLRRRPWTRGVLAVVLARSAILGACDVLLVVLAFDEFDLDASGAGLLNALVGAGAVISAVVATLVVRRTHLAPWLNIGLAVSAAVFLLLGAVTELPVAIATLPLLGLAASLLDGLARMLLQRSADPRLLGSMFALIELVGGIGLLVGSGVAQGLVAVADIHVALHGLGVLLGLALAVTVRAVRRADAGADVPVVEMSVLHELAIFAPLPPLELEAVARSAEHVSVSEGEVVIRQGEPGARFYAVVDGAFDVVMSGEHIRTARRGSCFGEVALLADVGRTATVTARSAGELLAVPRVPFLIAVTGTDSSHAAAWGQIQDMPLYQRLVAEEAGAGPAASTD
jgi:MFS family permease